MPEGIRKIIEGDSDEEDDDSEETGPGTLKAPRSQTPNLIKLSDLKREQAKDADLSELRELLEAHCV